jgi:hypothetical protein
VRVAGKAIAYNSICMLGPSASRLHACATKTFHFTQITIITAQKNSRPSLTSLLQRLIMVSLLMDNTRFGCTSNRYEVTSVDL